MSTNLVNLKGNTLCLFEDQCCYFSDVKELLTKKKTDFVSLNNIYLDEFSNYLVQVDIWISTKDNNINWAQILRIINKKCVNNAIIKIVFVGKENSTQELIEEVLIAGFCKVEIINKKKISDGLEKYSCIARMPSWNSRHIYSLEHQNYVSKNTEETQQVAKLTVSDCSTKPRACANCTCGRKNKETVTIDTSEITTAGLNAGCGNCKLGDSFRCESCPYKGLPAFTVEGDKIKLSSTSDK